MTAGTQCIMPSWPYSDHLYAYDDSNMTLQRLSNTDMRHVMCCAQLPTFEAASVVVP
jgi:hypothetical protein